MAKRVGQGEMVVHEPPTRAVRRNTTIIDHYTEMMNIGPREATHIRLTTYCSIQECGGKVTNFKCFYLVTRLLTWHVESVEQCRICGGHRSVDVKVLQ